jgi:hypothetical protein
VFESNTSSPNVYATLFHGKGLAFILTRMGLATFWAIFSQTHLVTLPGGTDVIAPASETEDPGSNPVCV